MNIRFTLISLEELHLLAPNEIWSSDITYIRTMTGYMYLVAVIDWFSRFVISWRLSNSLTEDFCIESLKEAYKTQKKPADIMNVDQGGQFTSINYITVVLANDSKISMDGKGRALDNIFVERLWRSLKYEEVYLKEYLTGLDVHEGIKKYLEFYNNDRPHQSLGYRSPREVHFGQ